MLNSWMGIKNICNSVCRIFRYITEDPIDALIDEELEQEEKEARKKAILRVSTWFAERSASYIEKNSPLYLSEQMQKLKERFSMYAFMYEKVMREERFYRDTLPEMFERWSAASSRLERLFEDYDFH